MKKVKTVKNYTEYKKLLKASFGEYEIMPEQVDIQAFIESNSLYDDWKIIESDVEQDIRKLILKPKAHGNSTDKKGISSYKQYLKKLHKTFGIPSVMPEFSKINTFIDEYELFSVWGITIDDVSKDLQGFIDGKYDEMIRDAKPVKKQNTRKKSEQGPIELQTYKNTVSTISNNYRPPRGYTTNEVKQSLQKQKKTYKEKKKVSKPISKTNSEKVYFLDGDNHINEGQMGIERLPKSNRFIAFFSQQGAKSKFDTKYRHRPNVSSKLVKPGNQAVDNQIKAEVGQMLKEGNKDITIVSHDKGFEKYRDRKNRERKGNRVRTARSVKEDYSKKKR